MIALNHNTALTTMPRSVRSAWEGRTKQSGIVCLYSLHSDLTSRVHFVPSNVFAHNR
jgi:hypothetical protein